jgi:hypothetical protein
MRKLILLILSSAMLVAGTYAVVFELLFANLIWFRFVFGGAILALLGGYLLWTDFVALRLGIRTWED